jgi:hypothetical protein
MTFYWDSSSRNLLPGMRIFGTQPGSQIGIGESPSSGCKRKSCPGKGAEQDSNPVELK